MASCMHHVMLSHGVTPLCLHALRLAGGTMHTFEGQWQAGVKLEVGCA
jgi:hypothetical protein